MVLGADAVQIGSLFAATEESSAHINFKQKIIETKEGDTQLTLKELAPVRLIKNAFYKEVEALYEKGATLQELKTLLGRGRAKKGIFEGDLENGELEIGQISGMIHKILPVEKVVETLLKEFEEAKDFLQQL